MHQPEFVVGVLNGYYATAEQIMLAHGAVHVKFSGDEVLGVFPSAPAAVQTAVELQRELNGFLHTYRLSVGIGLDSGPVVEGLLGGRMYKEYDVIGAAVNTAKRLESATPGGEITISHAAYKLDEQELSEIPLEQSRVPGDHVWPEQQGLHAVRDRRYGGEVQEQ